MSKLTFNGKMKSCALQIGKTNKPRENSLQPRVSRAPSSSLHCWKGRGRGSEHPEDRDTPFRCGALPVKLIGLTKPESVLTYCPLIP